MKQNSFLLYAGCGTALTSMLHVAMIIGGADWYRFFGAGEGMAQLAESGSTYPALITGVIALILTIWACYAFSGAGIIKRLPFLKLVLALVAAIFIIRGVFGIPIVIYTDDPYLDELESKMTFMIFSSLVSLGLGLLYLIGLMQIRRRR